jgi:hypothetical protein
MGRRALSTTTCLRPLPAALAAVTMLAATMGPAAAAPLTFTLPGFFNNGTDDPTTLPSTDTVGTFTGLPTGFVVGAKISGFFGTLDSLSTAGVELFLDGLLVATCNSGDACENGSALSPVPWSFTLTADELALLTDGSATLTAEQTDIGQVNIDVTTLQVTVPEPASLALLGLPLVLGAARRFRRRAA